MVCRDDWMRPVEFTQLAGNDVGERKEIVRDELTHEPRTASRNFDSAIAERLALVLQYDQRHSLSAILISASYMLQGVDRELSPTPAFVRSFHVLITSLASSIDGLVV